MEEREKKRMGPREIDRERAKEQKRKQNGEFSLTKVIFCNDAGFCVCRQSCLQASTSV